MGQRKLAPTGEAAVRRIWADHPNPNKGQEMIDAWNNWEPKPPIHAPGEMARMPEGAFQNLCNILGVERATQQRDRINALADQRNAEKRAGKHSTLFKAWTPERVDNKRKQNAERSRRYRERQRTAIERLGLTGCDRDSSQPDI